ncbi:response regulator transcription factor [Neptunomonas sp. XY-337]|uniref:response regulator transcription factor n=1 Tax=Neptunomonas sp. XY-337 TaxID=2561897 RepID=UPI0010A9FC45|nr:response regulator transcription factor [Neptunomonas sp. XY-337]
MNAAVIPAIESPRILVIEDDPTLSALVREQLDHHGFCTTQAFDGLSGLQEALKEPYHLILLDVLLPKMDGFEVLSKLRQHTDTPVVMLSARGAEEDRICGFRSGADDYLPKPFNVTELLLRINAIMRRSHEAQPQKRSNKLTVGDGLALFAREQVAMLQSEPMPLTAMEFRLLWLLAEQQGETLSKPYLYQTLMDRPYSRYDRSLDMHISKLRRKLQDVGFDSARLVTRHGKGYSLT